MKQGRLAAALPCAVAFAALAQDYGREARWHADLTAAIAAFAASPM